MAKGFTVKAKNPKPKKAAPKPEFDYVKAKEMIKERQLYSVYLVDVSHISFSRVLYLFVLI